MDSHTTTGVALRCTITCQQDSRKSTGILTALTYYQELSAAQNALLKCIISVSSITQRLTKTRDYVPGKVTTGKTKVHNTQTLCGLDIRGLCYGGHENRESFRELSNKMTIYMQQINKLTHYNKGESRSSKFQVGLHAFTERNYGKAVGRAQVSVKCIL